MTFVILTGGIDLSIGSVVALAGVAPRWSRGKRKSLCLVSPRLWRSGWQAGHLTARQSLISCAAVRRHARRLTIARGLAFIFPRPSIGSLPESFGRLENPLFSEFPGRSG
jgi:predicted ABC-type sugar transport system permease subunit